PAELIAHGREQFVREVRLAARAEPLIERYGQRRHRHAFVDGGLYGPAAFAGVGYPSGEFRQRRILGQGRGAKSAILSRTAWTSGTTLRPSCMIVAPRRARSAT